MDVSRLLGLEDMIANFFDMWNSIPNNKTVGALWPNTPTATLPSRLDAAIEEAGSSWWTRTVQNATETSRRRYPSSRTERGSPPRGVIPPGLHQLLEAGKQQGFNPKIARRKALLFPQSVFALAASLCLHSECWWHPTHPFKSSLTGETCMELATDYEQRSGEQWTQPLLHYVCGEMAVWTLQNAKDPTDKQSIIEAVRTMKFDSIAGPIDFSAPVAQGTKHPVPNVSKSPQAGGQWIKYPPYDIDIRIVANSTAPDAKVEFELKSLEEFAAS